MIQIINAFLDRHGVRIMQVLFAVFALYVITHFVRPLHAKELERSSQTIQK